MSSKPLSVFLVDDHAVVRAGYRHLLEKHDAIEVVGEAADGGAAYRAYKTLTPDVVIMDLSLPGRGGIDVIRQILQWDSSARVLVFTMHLSPTIAMQAFRAGAKAYITKSSPPELLVSAVFDVAEGRIAVCPEIRDALAINRLQGDKSLVDELSPREFEILRMLLDARSNDDIAEAFNLSAKTVANYHYTIKSKLGVSSDIELVYFGLSNGLVEPIKLPECILKLR